MSEFERIFWALLLLAPIIAGIWFFLQMMLKPYKDKE